MEDLHGFGEQVSKRFISVSQAVRSKLDLDESRLSRYLILRKWYSLYWSHKEPNLERWDAIMPRFSDDPSGAKAFVAWQGDVSCRAQSMMILTFATNSRKPASSLLIRPYRMLAV